MRLCFIKREVFVDAAEQWNTICIEVRRDWKFNDSVGIWSVLDFVGDNSY